MEVAIARRSVAHRRSDDYALTAVRGPRPETGRTTALVECEHCGQAVACRVYSVADTQRMRARWRLVTVLSAVAVVAIIVAFTIIIAGKVPNEPTPQPEATLLGLSGLAAALGVLLSIRARRLAREEDGVRLAAWFGTHRLRWSSIIRDDQ
ncbi:hypothetical protein ACFQFC_31650 [Amorphoplanes digitatis]|uniref:Uncharacterized protein n=1 Tax=Actinoplanes digitatis TaxID=1868 RepID=A0A7W7HTY1_9ACTN|nr:hypothetical protein [Actinoplanes digitatis]MBB4760712.1 hypothetical protein [Actinoplanes digitatis]BFE68918.1 hypothetical protein GCM10020092_022190 [Actinoplanes digitatis]GID94266.1 hypothetical protein Adi01nite_36780 [Actinoplanes digitatis]